MKIKESPARKAFIIFNYIFLALFALVFILPVLHVLFASFSDPAMVSSHVGLIVWPLGKPTLGGYKIVLGSPNISTGYLNTLWYLVVGVGISMLLTIIGAYCLSRQQFAARNVFMMIISFTMLFNGGMIPTYMLVRGLGLYDSRFAVILPMAISVFNLIIMRTSFQSVPVSLEEAARIDGANDVTILFHVIIPLSKAVIAVIFLYYAVGIWNSWFPAMIYLKSQSKFPLQLMLRQILLVNNDNTVMMTSSSATENADLQRKLVKYCTIVVGTVPIMCFYPFIQKYFTKGVMIGAVKG